MPFEYVKHINLTEALKKRLSIYGFYMSDRGSSSLAAFVWDLVSEPSFTVNLNDESALDRIMADFVRIYFGIEPQACVVSEKPRSSRLKRNATVGGVS